jgi:8-oxo-dGTP diphosphatase
MSRVFPERPIVGVGAVVLDGGRVLLVRRAHEPLKGEWSLPGGALELGETLAGALVREVQEETGLQIRVGPVVEVLDRVHRAADGRVEYHFVLVDYLCAPIGGRLMPNSDAADARWANVDELTEYRLAVSALEVIAKAAHMHAGAAKSDPTSP